MLRKSDLRTDKIKIKAIKFLEKLKYQDAKQEEQDRKDKLREEKFKRFFEK